MGFKHIEYIQKENLVRRQGAGGVVGRCVGVSAVPFGGFGGGGGGL